MAESQVGLRVVGTGMFLPEKVVTNHDIEKFCDTTDEWIQKRTGIKERHFAEDGVGSSVLGTEAAKMALANSGVTAEEIDMIICCTVSPDQVAPGNAHLIQANIGAKNAAAFDLNSACSGFLYGLATADAYIRVGMFKTILLIGAETASRFLNWEHRDTAVLFADGAGALVLQADTNGSRVLTSNLGSDGTGEDILGMPQGGFRYDVTPEFLKDNPKKIVMNGRELFKYAVRKFEEEIHRSIEAAGVTADDIDLFVPHQANARIIELVRERVGMPSEKVFVNIDHTGNTVAASIPMALHEACQADRIHEGDLVLLVAFGAGLTWASALLRW